MLGEDRTFCLTIITEERRINHYPIEVTFELNYPRQSIAKQKPDTLRIPGSRKGCAKS